MIKPNELRIGNIVMSLFNPVTIIETYEHSALVKFTSGKQEVYKYSDLIEISLTTDRILDYGFESVHENPRLENFLINKQTYYPYMITVSREGDFYFNENLEIKTLNHLQNHFYFTTGEELEIKDLK